VVEIASQERTASALLDVCEMSQTWPVNIPRARNLMAETIEPPKLARSKKPIWAKCPDRSA